MAIINMEKTGENIARLRSDFYAKESMVYVGVV